MNVVNLPTAASKKILIGKFEGGRIVIATHGEADTGRVAPLVGVCELAASNPGALAYDIALIMERCRNIGYAHAQADFRKLLGIKP